VLDLTRSNGAGIQAGLAENRIVVCLEVGVSQLRRSAAEIATVAATAPAKEDNENEETEDEHGVDGEGD